MGTPSATAAVQPDRTPLATPTIGVAAALELDADAFASLDVRQRAVAHKAGLKLLPKTLPAHAKE